MRDKKLNTVCEEARCPNLHECWSESQTATFMILGDTCTRGRRFCAVKTGRPNELDWGEPERVAESVEVMGLKHDVITAVARDDLTTVVRLFLRKRSIEFENVIPEQLSKFSHPI